MGGVGTNHIFTFYYGEEHLSVKASCFLKEGLKQNEKCFYSFNDIRRKKILNNVNENNLNAKQLEFLDIKEIINSYLKQGKKALENEFIKIISQAKEEGYKSIRILSDPLVAKEVLEDDKLIIWEQELDEILMNINDILILCPYNVRSLINVDTTNENKSEQKFIKDALKAHASLLSAEELYKINDGFNLIN